MLEIKQQTSGRGKEFQHDEGVLEIQCDGCHSEALAEKSHYLSQLQNSGRAKEHLGDKFCNYFSSLRVNVVSVAIQPLNGKHNNCPPTPNLTSRKTILNCFARQSPLERGKAAFTLAEVLITLGIIGVVAAMTLPALIQKNNSKALETAFKKSYANLYNAFNLVIAEGYPVYVLNPTQARPDGDVNMNPEFAKQVFSKYIKIKRITNADHVAYTKSAKNLTKSNLASFPQCSQFMNGNAYILPDGSSLAIQQNCGGLWFTMDTNGIKKGPNALGHDIFIFVAMANTTKLIPAYFESEVKCDEENKCSYNNTTETAQKCSNTSQSNINGTTCASYAISNTCPWDNTKTYWECLP